MNRNMIYYCISGYFLASDAAPGMTMACVAGLATPDAGRIVVNGQTFFDSQAGINLRPQQRRVGYVTQDYLLFPHLTVWQNVAVVDNGRLLQIDTPQQIQHRPANPLVAELVGRV